jgi:hypothetical protein
MKRKLSAAAFSIVLTVFGFAASAGAVAEESSGLRWRRLR